jgi:hypothetical protein
MADFSKPQPVEDLDLAFGHKSLFSLGDWQGNEILPSREDIPDEFLRHDGTKWNKAFGQWFFSGFPEGTQLQYKEGIDPEMAMRHLRAVMTSWSPKHEHKDAACSYLLSMWVEDIVLADGTSWFDK